MSRSLGSSLAIQLAADHTLTRLVLIAPFESILSIASRTAPFLPMRLLLRDPCASWRCAHRVTSATLILIADHDELVPLADTQRLLAAFPPNTAPLRVFPNTNHNSVSDPPEFWEALRDSR